MKIRCSCGALNTYRALPKTDTTTALKKEIRKCRRCGRDIFESSIKHFLPVR